MFRYAWRVPTAVGLKVTLMVQVPPEGTNPLQLSVSEKSPGLGPVKVMLLMISEPPPLFNKLTGDDALDVPTFTMPKLI